MSNEIALSASATFVRTSKTGKKTTRTALGVLMSGNASERKTLTLMAAQALIDNNSFAPVMAELIRVVPPSKLLKFGVFKIVDGFGFYDQVTKTVTMIDGRWSLATAESYCRAVDAMFDSVEEGGKEVKGERNIAWDIAMYLMAHADEKAAAKLAALTTA